MIQKSNRRCYNCQRPLIYSEFYRTNRVEYSKETLDALWSSNIVELFCCACFKMFKKKLQLEKLKDQLFPRYCAICNKKLEVHDPPQIYQAFPMDFLLIIWLNSRSNLYCDQCTRTIFSKKELAEKRTKNKWKENFSAKHQSEIEDANKKTRKIRSELPRSEDAFLNDLEKELDFSIPFNPIIGRDSYGFSVFEDHISALSLSNCDLQDIPPKIENLKFLRKLFLNNNSLLFIPNTFKHLKSLRILFLENNNIGNIPYFLRFLTCLKHLSLWGNLLDYILEHITTFSSLKYLNLSYNSISDIPEFLFNHKSLRFLYLIGNNIEYLPQIINKREHIILKI